ncbi:BamA/TamA family outer membrane protein [Catalinimonas sp. 4WD22]|uniref:BamA/TamA family outer membrane protein n=1 Tax=Catalinimonas locisalis TaxID=3133978 RepID=UPI003100F907
MSHLNFTAVFSKANSLIWIVIYTKAIKRVSNKMGAKICMKILSYLISIIKPVILNQITKNPWKTVIILTLIGITPLFAQEAGVEKYHSKTVVLPFASYTPETRLMFGGLLMYQFKPRAAGIETRASQILSSGIYTLNHQLIFEFLPNVILPQEQWLLDGTYQYAFFPNNYWGIGAYTLDDDKVNVEYRRINFQQTVLRKIASKFYAGPILRWSRLSAVEFTDQNDDQIPTDMIKGGNGSSLSGIGFTIRWDKRNSITYPTENHYLDLSTLFYPEILGTTHPHLSWQLDGRKYMDLKNDKNSVLAFHFRLRMTTGELPFQEYSLLGGREILRGYFEGRFRDANAAQVQAEFRQHLYKRFGLAVFIGAGEVWNKFEHFNLDNPKYAGGMGLRFNLNPEDRSNIRIDYGIGKHDRGLYITIGEAF